MLTVALDASGDDNDSVLVVAGFISSARDWNDFSREWEDRLAKDGIAYFHAVEWAHCRKQFEGWKNRERDRQRLASDLMDILHRHAYRQFACGVLNEAFQKIEVNLRKQFRLCAYSLAGRTVARLVRDWCFSEHIAQVELVFEAGDSGDTDLRQRFIEDLGYEPLFRPKKDTPLPDGTTQPRFVPLQAADWLAYELARLIKNPPDFDDMRWPMKQFYRFHGSPQHYSIEDTANLERLLQASKDLTEWTKNLRRSVPAIGHDKV